MGSGWSNMKEVKKEVHKTASAITGSSTQLLGSRIEVRNHNRQWPSTHMMMDCGGDQEGM